MYGVVPGRMIDNSNVDHSKLLHGVLAMAQHTSSVFPYSPTEEHCRLLPRSTAPFFLLMGFMGGAQVWAGITSSLTQLVCTPGTPMIACTWCQWC
jgi:hypothetical protein